MPRLLKKENLYLQNITVALVIETTVVEIPLAPILPMSTGCMVATLKMFSVP